MELVALLAALEASCDGREATEDVQVPAELLLAAQQELKGKAQMAKDLEMARDEASMKPSVARKLNEKIRALESELEQLRSNKKVKELEKKVQFLEHELKQSYTTKNFTLKSGLLELEKQYRAHMNVDPNMQAFWDDITVLLDEKKDRDTFQPKGPRMTAPSAVTDIRTSRPSSSSGAGAPATAATAAGVEQSGSAQPTPRKDTTPTPSTSTAAAAADGQEQSSGSTAVAMQVDTFNTIISEEAASAATLLGDLNSGKQESGEMVVRHGAGFRVVRPAGTKDPTADVTAADSSSASAAAAAAGGGVGQQGQQAQQLQLQQQAQAVSLLRQEFAERAKDVTFHAMPASKQQLAVASADASAAVQQPIAAEALQQQSDAVTSSLQDLLQQFSTLAATATQLPQPPAPAGSTADQQQQQLSAGEVDTASLWQHQLQQLLESAQHLKQQVAENSQSAETLQQQAGAAEGLLESVCRMLAVLQGTRSSSSSDPAGQAAVADAVQVLSALKQELQELQYSLQRLAAEAAGQRMLVCVFGEFLTQLQEQGVVAPEAAAAGIAAALDSTLEQQQESASQPAMLTLLQSFLEANPQVPQMLAVQLAPAVPPMQQEEVQEALPAVELSSTAVQAVADAEHQEVQAVADAEHREVQAVADAEHREVQCEAADSQHAGTQSELLPTPSDHVQTQTETAADHAGTQTDVLQPSTSHVSTQAAAEAVSTEVQTSPPSPVAAAVQTSPPSPVAAAVQAESEASSQVDLPALSEASADAAANRTPAAAGRQAVESQRSLGDSSRHGSGIIYSASGSELSASKAAVGQQLDILHRLERSRAGDDPGEGGAGAAAVLEVKPEQLTDLGAVAKELGQLRADNMELAANLQVTQSLVDHLNTNLKAAIDKADDAEAEAVQVQQQLEKTVASLTQLQNEHAEVTHVLIEAKVELAEKSGELLKLIRDMKRAIAEQRANPANAAGVVRELESILAVVPSAGDDADLAHSPASGASRQGSSFDNAKVALGGLAAGFGHMREAVWGPAGRARQTRLSDSSSAQGTEGVTPTGSGVVFVKPDSEQPEKPT